MEELEVSRKKQSSISEPAYPEEVWKEILDSVVSLIKSQTVISRRQFNQYLQREFKLDSNHCYLVRWEASLVLYAEHIQRTGKIPYKKRHGFGLYSWISQNRILFKNKKLSKYKIEKLKAINFAFKPVKAINDALEERWLGTLAALRDYVAINGELPPTSSKTQRIHNGLEISAWFLTQFYLYKKNKLKKNRTKLLKTLIDLYIARANNHKDTLEFSWEAHLEAYKEFKLSSMEEPKEGCVFSGYHLGTWVNNVRAYQRKGWLSRDKYNKLKLIGFNFDPKFDEWFSIYKKLVEYYNLSSKLPNTKITHKGSYLGVWTRRNFKALNDGRLDPKRKALLLKLGVDFNHYK